METAKAAWTRDSQRSFYARLTERCLQIRNGTDPKGDYRKASQWVDRIYNNVAMPPRALISADNRLLLALMAAEDRAD